MPKVAVVIPAHNAARTLGELISSVSRQVPPENIFVVDDGSTDETELIARDLGVWLLKHSRRKGKGVALRDGAMKALELNSELIITMDSDLQHDPAEIPVFLEAAARFDLVIGKRSISTKDMPVHRFLSNSLTSRILSSRTGANIEDSQCGYRLYKSDVLRKVDSACRHFDYESDMLLKAVLAGYRVGFIPIKTIYNESVSYIRVIDILRFIRVYLKSFPILNGKIRTA
jgi:glycosyltransferase involved in cell wall biosynthesis